ncbi:conserved hypothetical protein [Planktothrix sp. PCC 11201]|uniref:hypothetical protein n=1 Tax=Planktothrix sp. PCC 11201 TaxID=1729650 RepID=UPI0009162C3C|nr:hypothetical protein [Planktothrix sp. PCC 11201]SKB15739.1 conserved hypothetical protein [Planktothrix sp. PCC 11201]
MIDAHLAKIDFLVNIEDITFAQILSMSDSNPKINPPERGYLTFLVPLAVVLFILQKAFPLAILTVGGWGSWRVWKYYQQRQQEQLATLDEVFYRLIRENQGRITALDLAMHTQQSGTKVQEYLDQRATEFAAQYEITDVGGMIYYFPTAQPSQTVEDPLLVVSKSEKENPNSLVLFPVNPASGSILPETLNQSELAQRLGVHPTTLSKWKTKPEFSDWSYQRDPDAICWSYSAETKRFSSQKSNKKISKISELMKKNKV